MGQSTPISGRGSASPGIRTLLIAHSQPVVVEGLRKLLAASSGLKVVGQTSSPEALLSKLRGLEPDALMIDPELLGSDRMDTLQTVCEQVPDLRVLVFASHCTDHGMIACLRAGVAGFVKSSAPPELIVRATESVARGETFIDPSITSTVLGQVRPNGASRGDAGPELTPRERDVLEMLVQGKRNRQIAQALDITERTVKFHLCALYHKLDVTNRTEAVLAAIRQGVTRPAGTANTRHSI